MQDEEEDENSIEGPIFFSPTMWRKRAKKNEAKESIKPVVCTFNWSVVIIRLKKSTLTKNNVPPAGAEPTTSARRERPSALYRASALYDVSNHDRIYA